MFNYFRIKIRGLGELTFDGGGRLASSEYCIKFRVRGWYLSTGETLIYIYIYIYIEREIQNIVINVYIFQGNVYGNRKF